MKKLISLFILGIFLISFTSALITKDFQIDEERKTELTQYGTITLKDRWFIDVFGWFEKDVKQITLESNTENCISNCEAIKKIELFEKGTLVDNVKFINLKTGKETTINDYTFYVKTGDKEIEVDVFEWVCVEGKTNLNGTKNEDCENKKVGTRIEYEPIWSEYKNEILGEGIYYLKLVGEKNYNQEIDWIIETNKIWLNEWAVWSDSFNVGLKSYYNFSDASGNIRDIINGNNLTISGTWTYGQAGIIGNAINTSDLASGLISASNFTGTRSLSFWYKKTGTPDNDAVLYAGMTYPGYPVNSPLLMHVSTNTAIGLRVNNANKANVVTPTNNVWYHYGLVQNTSGTYVFINGTLVLSEVASTDIALTTPISFFAGYGTSTSFNVQGFIDEVGVWNRSLSASEMSDLYNSGDGITYGSKSMSVTLNSPINYFNSSSSTITFNGSSTVEGATLTNMSLWNNKSGWSLKETQTKTGTTNTSIFNYNFVDDGTYLWNVQACDSDGECIFASANRTVSVDTTAPTVIINNGNGTFNYGSLTTNHTINYTITDTNLGSCWLNYNGTNRTISCTSGSLNTTNFQLHSNTFNATIYANDSVNNVGSQFFSWNYKVFENSRTHNNLIYETAKETYSINVTSDALLTSVTLLLNGTEFGTLTSSGSDIWSLSKDISLNKVGNNTISFNFSYSGDYFTSSSTYQYINSTIFGLCNTSLTTKFLNITFKDEVSEAGINGSINSLTFKYYLGDGEVQKTYSYSNTTENIAYEFCGTPSNLTKLNSTIIAYWTDYPFRYSSFNNIVSSSLTTKVISLLKNTEGLYQNVLVQNSLGTPISGAVVTATMTGETDILDERTTDGSGLVQLWLNPDFSHQLKTVADGYPVNYRTINPSGTLVTVTLGDSAATVPINLTQNCIEGISYSIIPYTERLENNTAYTFGFVLENNKYTLSSWGFKLYNSSNSLLTTVAGVGNEGTASTSYNVGTNSQIRLVGYWTCDYGTNEVSKSWNIINTDDAGYSIWFLAKRIDSYLDSGDGIFGLTKGFSLNLICFIFVIIVVGTLNFAYGLDQPFTLGFISFLLIGFLEYGLGLITSNTLSPTWVMGFILIVVSIREAIR
jgi:hypothetical protein